MTFTNGDAYIAIHKRMIDTADAMRHCATAFINGDMNDSEFITEITTLRKHFIAVHDFYEEVGSVFERIEQYI